VNEFDRELNQRLAAIREQGLHRELRRVDSAQGPRIEINGKSLINFSSNDYLGLANHPALKEAAIRAVEKYGAGAGASRLICGSLAPFHELEEALAAFKGTEAALTFSTGYSTALGTITALMDKDDVIILDKLVHASIVDAAKLSGAKLRVFAHNDLSDLEDKLKWADKMRSAERGMQNEPRVLIVTESVFSMDGDHAPLVQIVLLKERYGAWLMVDEAHATGLYGTNRRGLAEELGVSERIEIEMGTLGKAIGASGGYICGSRALVELLVNRARSFIFSTAPVPAAAGAAIAGLKIVGDPEGKHLQATFWGQVSSFQSLIRDLQPAVHTNIIPLMTGDEDAAIAAATALREKGFFVPAIRYPTVARGSARLRITFTAAHSKEEVEHLASTLSQSVSRKAEIPNAPAR
jgi:8-amino-7-oxononanoate synthase